MGQNYHDGWRRQGGVSRKESQILDSQRKGNKREGNTVGLNETCVPSCGQLCFLHLNKDVMELEKIQNSL